ncbi:MAG: hypothetical protein A3H36_05620 [Chloroflexi bacterium RIFCSPLOWO2_02_FULL_71_16]|nr:MAG: hypothetical protein A3H36_05620 [Chloroflexi bacterium RIFCSPLOWO2_02_FULL_71_16]
MDRVLAAVPPVAPPIGFRDAVLRRIRAERRSPYEWPMALALALPSLAYLFWTVGLNGSDIAVAIENVFALAAGTEGQAFFSVDGLLVLAFALLGVGALLGTHALITPAEEAGR